MEQKSGKLSRTVKILLGVAILFLLYTVLGFFVAPPVLKSVLARRLTEELRREVSIKEIRMNPYALTLRVAGFSVKERGGAGDFVSFDELFLNLQAVSLFKRALVLSEFRLTGPSFHVVRTGETTFNFSDLIQREEAPAKTPPEPSKPLRFSLSNIIISNGGVEVRDEVKGQEHRIEGIGITLPFVSNFPYNAEAYLEPGFQAKVNGTPVSFSGRTRPFLDTLETTIDIDIQALDLTRYLAYLPFDLPYRVDSGLMDLKTEIAYAKSRERDTLYLSGNVTLSDFKASEKTGEPINEIPRAELHIDRSDVLSGKVHIKKLSVTSPRARLVRDSAGELNLAKLLAVRTGKEVVRQEGKAGFVLIADEISFSDGRIEFRDEKADGPFAGYLEKLDVHVSGFSNEPGKQSGFSLSLRTDAGEEVKTEGDMSVNPLAVNGRVGVSHVPLKRYAPYYGNQIAFSVEEGDLDVEADYRVAMKDGEAPQIRLSGLSTTISSLKLKMPQEKSNFYEVSSISLSDTSVDLTEKRLVVGAFSTKDARLRMSRSEKGVISLQELLPPPASAAPAGEEREKTPENPAPDGGDWTFLLKRGEVAAYSVAFEDRVTTPPVNLLAEGISLAMEDVSNSRDSRGRLSLDMGFANKGTIKAQGALSINPLTADLKLDVKDIDIRQFEPYWRDMIHLTLTRGAASTSGTAQFARDADARIEGKFRGEVRVSGFAAVDRARSEDFLNWKSLHVSGIDMSLNPAQLAVNKVALSGFYSRISIDEKGNTNIQGLLPSSGQEEKAPAGGTAAEAPAVKGPDSRGPAAAPFKINVKTIALDGGRIHYTDHFIRPHVDADLTDLAGQVTGLTSEDTKYAEVDLKGRVSRTAPLEIKGKINPLGKELYLDLEIRTKGIDLSPATPYAGKYIGYTIAKGKLSMDLKYYIQQKKLAAENRVFLDQFTLGDTVESPDATTLPVALAISLLKNRAGEIKLDLPVSGSLDDPQFKLGKVILQMIVNLLQKVVTAPFSLLGAIAGGGEELSHVEFSPGSAELDESGRDKLAKLTEVLYDRPNLKIELEGHGDLQADKAALQEAAFLRKLKEQKLKTLRSSGGTGASLDEITLSPEEHDRFLKMWYLAERATEPKDKPAPAAEAKEKSKPVPEATPEEMKRDLMGRIQVSDDDMRLLAQDRAETVRDSMLASGKVEAERVFLVEPKSLSPQKKEKVKDSRVDFRLK